MPRGTRKRNFKKKKTRTKQKIRKQRRTRRRRGGGGNLNCVDLHPTTKNYLRDKLGRCLDDGQVAAKDDEEYIKYHLTTIKPADGRRWRGRVTRAKALISKSPTTKKINEMKDQWDTAVNNWNAKKQTFATNNHVVSRMRSPSPPETERIRVTAAAEALRHHVKGGPTLATQGVPVRTRGPAATAMNSSPRQAATAIRSSSSSSLPSPTGSWKEAW
jgi:hypothetical protein